MFKAVILLKRRDDLGFEDFRRWWLEEHRPLARRLPGLRRAVFNLVEAGGEAEFDGISELWFDSEQAFADAYASDTGKRVAADSMAMVARRVRLPVQEHEVLP